MNARQTLHDLIFGASCDSSFLLDDVSFGSRMHYVNKNLQQKCDQGTCNKFLKINILFLIVFTKRFVLYNL